MPTQSATLSPTPRIVVPPTWTAAGSTLEPHDRNSAILLWDGSVLIVDSGGAPTAEVYDSVLDAWTATGAMDEGRYRHTATLLPDGTVLVVGGGGSLLGLPLASTQLYDPATNGWSASGTMAETRAGHTATMLLDGMVLVVGGAIDPDGEQVLASAELFDPGSGARKVVEEMSGPRSGHTATLLPDGRVLIVGGYGRFVSPMESSTLASAELYDAGSGKWTTVGNTADPRSGHTATLLPDGTVLVAGGSAGYGRAVASAEVYDPGDGSWSAVEGLSVARYDHTATLLANGTVLITGGIDDDTDLTSAELYDPGIGQWTATASLATPRSRHSATLLNDGRVIVVGGADSGAGEPFPAELYDPGSGT